MKRYLLFILLITITLGVSAQKSVRKSIRKGNNAYKEQRYSAAEADYAKALGENAASKEASFNLANTYYKQGRWDEALKEYQHYLTLENKNPKKMSSAWSNMGNTFLKKKANEKELGQGGLSNQGQQQEQSADNLKMSMDAYKNALRLNPQDDATRENLAIVQKMIKDQEGGGGGGNDDKDKEEQQEEQEQDQQNQNNDKQDQQKNEDQMSQDNVQQILQAIEQQEKETQERVNQLKAGQKKEQMDRNKQQNKDW